MKTRDVSWAIPALTFVTSLFFGFLLAEEGPTRRTLLNYTVDFSYKGLPSVVAGGIRMQFHYEVGMAGLAKIFVFENGAWSLKREKALDEKESVAFIDRLEGLGVRALRDMPKEDLGIISDGFKASVSVECMGEVYNFQRERPHQKSHRIYGILKLSI